CAPPCSGAVAVFLAGAFFAAFAGALLTAAVFFAGAFFGADIAFFAVDCAFAAAFCNRHRFLVAAMILAIPSLLIRRFAFGALAGADGSDSPRIFAHLAFCAIAIFRLEAAENLLRLRVGAFSVVADLTGPPISTARSSAI